MRWRVKTKEAVVITLLTFFVVATTTLIHLSQLNRVVTEEGVEHVELIAKQIYLQSRRALARDPEAALRETLQHDPDLRSLVDDSVGLSRHLLYSLIADEEGVNILHSEQAKEGSLTTQQPSLGTLLTLGPVRRFVALYQGDGIYEERLPLELGGKAVGSIRLGVSASLLRRELNAALVRSAGLAGLAVPIGWIVAMGLSSLILRPIRTLARDVDLLRRGQFEVIPNLTGSDEVGELATQLQLLGREMESQRLRLLSETTHLQQVVDHLEDGVILLNHERQILFFNKSGEAVMGHPLERAIGMRLEELMGPFHPLPSLLTQAAAQQDRLWSETVSLSADGHRKEYLVSLVFVADARQTMGVMVLLRDLESLHALQSAISYSAKLATLGRLTSGIAHEVKNPMNTMMIHAELLKEKLRDSPEGIQQNLEVIRAQIRRLDRVVQGFLKFVRPHELNLKPVDLNGLLEEVASLMEAEWEAAGVRFVLRGDPTLRPVTTDRELLRQAFLNIILNACQAMPEGGTVSIATAPASRDTVTVTIADEGVGIAPEALDKIFGLYYTTKPAGSGIGLSLVYRTLQMLEGTIDVVSDVGGGTTMTVRLPMGPGRI